MKTIRALSLAASGGLVLTLAACGGSSEGDEGGSTGGGGAAGETTITWWHNSNTGEGLEYYTQLERGNLRGASEAVLDALASRASAYGPSAKPTRYPPPMVIAARLNTNERLRSAAAAYSNRGTTVHKLVSTNLPVSLSRHLDWPLENVSV